MPMKSTALYSWLSLVLLMMTIPAVVQAQFTFTTNNGTITITGYTGTPTTLTIPSTTNGYPVTRIGSSAFYNCTSLTSITIPNGVTSIGDSAFSYCTSLTNITIGSGVTSIGSNTFYYCCSLTAISVDTNNLVYSTVDGVLFNKNQTTLVEYPGGIDKTSYTIPSSVTNIGDSAFSYCTSLTNITIPNSVISIGDRAFFYCTSLTNITIPNRLTNIGESAFSGCHSLTGILVDTNSSAYSSRDGVLFNKSQTTLIQYPEGKTGSYTIPNSVNSIGDRAFYYCSRLSNITIPNSVPEQSSGY